MANSPLTPLETLVSRALTARLHSQSLTLAPSEVNSLCELLEEFVTLKAKLARPNNGRPRIHSFASDKDRQAYYNARRKRAKQKNGVSCLS